MTDVTITHTEVLEETLPTHWNTFWAHVLTRPAITVYESLRRMGGQEVVLEGWARSLGLSTYRLRQILRELERWGFIDVA